MQYMFFGVIFLIYVYVGCMLYKVLKNKKIAELSFKEFLIVINFFTILPIILLLSIYIYATNNVYEHFYIVVVYASILFYFLRKEMRISTNSTLIYIPAVFSSYSYISLLLSPIVFLVKYDFYLFVPVFVLFYSLLIFSYFNLNVQTYFFSLIPFFVLVIIQTLNNLRKRIIEYFPFVYTALVSFLMLIFEEIYQLVLVLISIVLYVMRRWDDRIPVGFAIYFLILSAILLAKGFESYANDLAILAYWNLVVGVVSMTINFYKEERKNKNLEAT